MSQRLILSLLFFFLLCVAERTFRQVCERIYFMRDVFPKNMGLDTCHHPSHVYSPLTLIIIYISSSLNRDFSSQSTFAILLPPAALKDQIYLIFVWTKFAISNHGYQLVHIWRNMVHSAPLMSLSVSHSLSLLSYWPSCVCNYWETETLILVAWQINYIVGNLFVGSLQWDCSSCDLWFLVLKLIKSIGATYPSSSQNRSIYTCSRNKSHTKKKSCNSLIMFSNWPLIYSRNWNPHSRSLASQRIPTSIM